MDGITTKYCKVCGESMPKHIGICPTCGAKQAIISLASVEICKCCGKKMASNLNKCPHCGSVPLRMKICYALCAAVSVITIFLLFNVFSTTNENTNTNYKVTPETTTNTITEELIYVSATELINQYSENEVAANQMYRDKTIVVNGIISEIGETVDLGVVGGTPYVLFSNNNSNGKITFTTVQCNFSNSEEIEKLANLKKGQPLYIIGTCTGESLYNIIITDCYLY